MSDIDEKVISARYELDRLLVEREEIRRAEREERRKAEQARQNNHRAEMAAEYLPGLPESVTDRVYSLAWQEGHSSGYDDVESYYADFAEFAKFVWGQALKQCPAQP